MLSKRVSAGACTVRGRHEAVPRGGSTSCLLRFASCRRFLLLENRLFTAEIAKSAEDLFAPGVILTPRFAMAILT